MYKATIHVDQGDQKKVCNGDTLSSGGLGPCIAIAIYNPKTKCGVMMHEANFATHYNLPELLENIIKDLGNPTNLKVYATGNSAMSIDEEDEMEYIHSHREYVEEVLPKYFKKKNIKIVWLEEDYTGELILETDTGNCIFEAAILPSSEEE